jgi:hypothetical protein
VRKLAVVVTCSDRKSAPVAEHLRIRSLEPGDVCRRVSAWTLRLDRELSQVPLHRLYRGEHWRQTESLMAAAEAVGFSPELWIASAGLGLQHAEHRAPAYGATFASRHPDSVGTTTHTSSQWWTELNEARGARSLEGLAKEASVLVVLSETYSRAMRKDLQAVADASADAVLIGGAEDIDGLLRVPSDRSLRHELRGTLASLNTRMATEWLRMLPGTAVSSPAAKERWGRWVPLVARAVPPPGATMTDHEVRQFIRDSLLLQPRASRGRLLRDLRDSGRACEYSRFGRLYAAVTGAT